MFTVETTDGTELAQFSDLQDAILEARQRLEDDPELAELTVWETGPKQVNHLCRNPCVNPKHLRLVTPHKVVRTVTFGPDADWQSVVVDLAPGEKISAPDNSWRQFLEPTDEQEADFRETFGYPVNHPKHPSYHSVHADIYDARAGK